MVNKPLLLEWAINRIEKGFSPIILIVGKQRMGKTFCGMRLAYELDNNFDPDKQMFFEIIDFARAVKQYDHKVLCLDEAGVELDTYRFSDARQRAFSHICQSQAYKQNTLIVILPHSSDLARCHRKYVDVLLVITGRGRGIVYKPTIEYWNMNDLDIKTKKMEMIYDIPKPPQNLIDSYKTKYEKQIKEGILDAEIGRLENHLGKGKPVKEKWVNPFVALNKTKSPPNHITQVPTK